MTPNELRQGSIERTDDQGTYTAYLRTCNFRECGTELTSRNRFGNYLMCLPCSRAKDRAAYSSKSGGGLSKAVAAAKRADPERSKAHSLLNDWLDRITSADTKQVFQSYLMTLEIKALMRHLPNVPTPTKMCPDLDRSSPTL